MRARASLLLFVLAALLAAAPARHDRTIDPATRVDHDGVPVARPAKRDIGLYAHMFHQAIVMPISHFFDLPDKILWLLGPMGVDLRQEAANANAFDEVPNSTWFTNRNHIRAVSPAEIRRGPFDGILPEKPWTVTELKKGGFNAGFQIKDANDKHWIIKLDRVGYPRASSGAGVVSSRLVWAAGYNISLEQAVLFRRDDLRFETQVASAAPDDPPVEPSRLDEMLEHTARSTDGSYCADASLFLPGKVVGPIDFSGKRKDDPNDWYRHRNRRELRGLYVFYSWLNNWDVKDQQSLDMFDETQGKEGHLHHYLLDVNGSLGAAAEGAKPLPYGYEKRIDFGGIGKRLVSFGFIREPWRKAPQRSGIASVGNFEGDTFHPKRWRPLQEVPPFHEMSPRDAYWGAKLVCSFSDAQIQAAIDAARYEDPRAPVYLIEVLQKRREKIARYWFDRVAPLDYFEVRSERLHFHDLARDLGMAQARSYAVELSSSASGVPERSFVVSSTEIPLPHNAPHGSTLSLELSLSGRSAKSVHVDLQRSGSGWVLTRIRHA